MKALLLSAYDAGSHRAWRENLSAMLPQISWTTLTLPPRYFSWRVRGNSLSWAFKQRATLTDHYDFLLCTSMTDLSALRGFVPPLGRLPTLVYCHENQFAYPENPLTPAVNLVEPQVLSLYTALCADRLVFNSAWNRDSFLQGVAALLRRLPDEVPAGLPERLARSVVLPVPLEAALWQPRRAAEEPDVLSIVWNHRWEFDKGPALLLAIVEALMRQRVRFRLHLLGQRFRQTPPEFGELQARLAQWHATTGIRPGHTDFVAAPPEYHRLLAGSDVVLSTALHDFQGLALQEASALGCAALAPARLVYPEYLAPGQLYQGHGAVAEQAASAAARLADWAQRKAAGLPLPVADVRQFHPDTLRPGYERLIHSLFSTPAAG
jgi:glycosyltransferase involved in cell wall biosynthesis